jgi:hypothetical protein
MEILEQNEIEKQMQLQKCDPLYRCLLLGHQCNPWIFNPCRYLHCGVILSCNGPFIHKITDNLKACGEGFYIKCPGFDDIGRVCDFEPAIDAAKWKEKVTVAKIEQLEAKVKELEVALKKRG